MHFYNPLIVIISATLRLNAASAIGEPRLAPRSHQCVPLIPGCHIPLPSPQSGLGMKYSLPSGPCIPVPRLVNTAVGSLVLDLPTALPPPSGYTCVSMLRGI